MSANLDSTEKLAARLLELNRDAVRRISEDALAANSIPPAATVLIQNLPALMADITKRSFSLGVAAAIVTVVEYAGSVKAQPAAGVIH